jgi:uncharacterized protein
VQDLPQIDRIEWDAWNREHIDRREVLPGEVEEVLSLSPVFRQTYKLRYQALGQTQAGRILSIILGENPKERGVYYVFSARPASRRERIIYHDLLKGADT